MPPFWFRTSRGPYSLLCAIWPPPAWHQLPLWGGFTLPLCLSGYFHLFAIVNNTSMNMDKYLFETLLSILDLYPALELLGHTITLFLILWRTTMLFPTVVVLFYIPTDSMQISVIPHSYQQYLCFFDSSHSNGYDAIYIVVFDLYFPNT